MGIRRVACLANISVSQSREHPHDVSARAHLVLLPLSLHIIKGKEYKNKEVCVCSWDRGGGMVQKYGVGGKISVCFQRNRRIPGLWVKIRCSWLVTTMDHSFMILFLFPKLFTLIKLHVKMPFIKYPLCFSCRYLLCSYPVFLLLGRAVASAAGIIK